MQSKEGGKGGTGMWSEVKITGWGKLYYRAFLQPGSYAPKLLPVGRLFFTRNKLYIGKGDLTM